MTTSAARATPSAALRLGSVADLHTHTTASDGLLSPVELVGEATAAGLAAIAITDHDTVDGIAEATAAAGPGLQVVPGIELAGTVGPREAHILGFFVDPTSPALLRTLAEFRRLRIDRMERFARHLTAAGLPLTLDEILAEASGGSVGRPHIARAMIRLGYVETIQTAFEGYLVPGCPTFVPKDEFSPEACIDVVRSAGGVAVLAHPFSTGDPDEFALRLAGAGLTGIEVEYGVYDEQRRAVLRDIAARHGLVATGGSDYHGPEHRENNRLGDGTSPMSTVAELARLAGR